MKRTLLVIDDSPFVCKAVTKALEGTDYEVVANALNGRMGLDLYQEHKPDVVTLDVTMPIMDGLETAQKLHEMDPNVKIIMLSAMGDDTLITQAKEIGVKHFLTKPFRPETLQDKLAEVF